MTLTSREHVTNKNDFLDQLAATQERLVKDEVDYRIVGSLATQAYLEEAGQQIAPLDFDREGAYTPDQRVPDIDIVVPRHDLEKARRIREDLLRSAFPIKMGLALPSGEIDFRPDEESSYLTHGDMAMAVRNELLAQRYTSYAGVPIQTVAPDTLLHTYGSFGGKVRAKDIARIKSLAALTSGAENSRPHVEFEPFHDFLRYRQANPGYLSVAGNMFERVTNHMSPRARNKLAHHALKAASLLGKR